jgi:menaquinone-dependent protoporphyrinogen oxidase
MWFLVAYASRHGSTRGVAERIGTRLEELGSQVTVLQVDAVDDVAEFDAAVVGSSVYFGAWSKNAVEFVRRNKHALSRMPVWLFSSGPLDSVELPSAKEIPELEASIKPRGHQVFAGRIDAAQLGVGEKLTLDAIHAPEGDFRDWSAIDRWAEGIIEEIRASAVA